MTKTLFRADSSATIGLGHIKRDLVYAKRLQNAQISFACFENTLDLSYPLHILSSNTIEELISLCKQEHIEHLIIDHYGISYEDEKKIKEELDIVLSVFDDSYQRHYCDEIINHNISAEPSKYTLEPFCRLSIIEPLIRDEFKRLPQRNREEKTGEVLISMGGVDTLNLTPRIIPLCHNFQKVHVVTSHINAHLDTLKSIQGIQLHIDTNRMAEIMDRCDLAILTPSVIVHEALYMHLPFIAVKTADNQEDLFHYLSSKGYTVQENFDEEALSELIERERMSHPFLHFAIRKTQDQDMMALFDLANDPKVRAASLNTSAIDLPTHEAWFSQAMHDPEQLLFTLLDGRGNFLGQLRFDLRKAGEALISISLVSASRGFSLAHKIISKGIGIMQRLHPERTIIAQIKSENIASIKSFEKAGFVRYSQKDDVLTYNYKEQS